jgi:hypothetical protein
MLSKNQNAFSRKYKIYNNSNMKYSNHKKKISHEDYKEAKQSWTPAKAKYNLIKLIDNNEIQSTKRKKTDIIEVVINKEKFLVNPTKPLTNTQTHK